MARFGEGVKSMGWLLLESLVALLGLVGIVAWTMVPARTRRRRPPESED
jgi:hypothetical protein